MLIVTAVLRAKPGKEKQLETQLLGMLKPVGQEEGTLEYRFHRAQEDAGCFFFYEKYRDQAAFDAHVVTPHFRKLQTEIADLLACPMEVGLYDELGSIRA